MDIKKNDRVALKKIYHKFLQHVRYNVLQLRTRVAYFAHVAEYISFLRKWSTPARVRARSNKFIFQKLR